KGNWKDFCDCLTPESRDMVAGMLVLLGSDMENQAFAAAAKGKDKVKDKEFLEVMRRMVKEIMKPLMDAYAKHGLSRKELEKFRADNPLLTGAKDPAKLKSALERAAKPVKDRTAF